MTNQHVPDDEHTPMRWRLVKDVPIALVAALLIQAGGLVWWAQGVAKDVTDHEKRLSVLESQRISERMAALESQMLDARSSLGRIENKLDRVIEARK